MIKRLLSFIYPLRLQNYQSDINGNLEINLVDGKKSLDTATSNYSYGSLQKILHSGLKALTIDNNVKNVLLLGLGGGSVVETLREDFDCEAAIEAVEIDPEMIEIALRDFNLGRFEPLHIVQANAFDYLSNGTKRFDLIIVDLFILDTIPEVFTKPETIDLMAHHLTTKGQLIYNTMNRTMPAETLSDICHRFSTQHHFDVRLLKNVEHTNTLIIVQPKQT